MRRKIFKGIKFRGTRQCAICGKPLRKNNKTDWGHCPACWRKS